MRVFIYGAPGAGKTTLALLRAERFGWPVHHLDTVFFYPGGESRDRDLGADEAARLAQGECWIIEGNHGAALEVVASQADRIVLLKVGRWQGALRLIRRRFWTPPSLSNKGPGGGPQILPIRLVRYTLFVHPRLEPRHLTKITKAAKGEVRAFARPDTALAWFA